jgi:hypothetical protein
MSIISENAVLGEIEAPIPDMISVLKYRCMSFVWS